jgi:serine/threonine-protein kinase PknK
MSGSDRQPETGLRVVVADDDVLLRAGLVSLMERAGMVVVGEAGDPATFLGLVRRERLDLVVVDVRMPPTQTAEGLEAARAVREELPDVGIVVLSAHVDVEHAATLLAAGGGIGYLLKHRVVDVEDFVDTLHRVARGGSVVDPVLFRELVAGHDDDPWAVLSPRERDVLRHIAEGRSNLGVAQALWITPATVEKHVRSILAKLCIPDSPADHRRVLAALTFLAAG